MKKVFDINASRLRYELSSMGMESDGSRSDLINRLQQAGVNHIDTNRCVPPELYNHHDTQSVYIGSKKQTLKSGVLSISNNTHTLIDGNFNTQTVNINNCLRIHETLELSCDTKGEEGDLRMRAGVLYMFRTTGVKPGWYTISFGRMMIF